MACVASFLYWEGPQSVRNDGSDNEKAKLAVFDFDGTCITGNSPVMLVRHLTLQRRLKIWESLLIVSWAAAYKLRLPQSESWVRSMVFKAFDGAPKEEVDAYLAQFYDDVVASRFRPMADRYLADAEKQGCEVIIVSATWDAIVERASKSHPFDTFITTRMVVDERGNYTREVDGLPIEGYEKVNAVRRYADDKFGVGNWKIEFAYGDHHSDVPLLEQARHSYVVNPDRPLMRKAKRNGWTVLDWKNS